MLIAAVYVLCGVTALTCAILLLRGYFRNRTRLLLWSGLCFLGLTLDNVLLFVDKVVYTEVSLLLVRELGALVGLSLLLYGLVWDTR
jgi:hypothetical protein